MVSDLDVITVQGPCAKGSGSLVPRVVQEGPVSVLCCVKGFCSFWERTCDPQVDKERLIDQTTRADCYNLKTARMAAGAEAAALL